MPVDYLVANPFQPRLTIDPVELQPLIDSITRYGFMGHIEARHDPSDQSRPLQIVFGHRRVEAAKQAGLKTVPVAINERSDDQMRRITFVENAARKALTYWEEALFLGTMRRELSLSVRQIADALSLSRTYVQERLDFLKLPEGPLRVAVERNDIGFSIARFLMQMPEAAHEDLLAQVLRGDLNVTDLRTLRHDQIELQRQQESHDVEKQDSKIEPSIASPAARVSNVLELRPGRIGSDLGQSQSSRMADIHQREDKSSDSNSPEESTITSSQSVSSRLTIRPNLEDKMFSSKMHQSEKHDALIKESAESGVSADGESDSLARPEARGVFLDRTIIPRRTGEDYAIQVVVQLEANLYHLQQKLAKADFTSLNDEMSARLSRVRDELSHVLTLLP